MKIRPMCPVDLSCVTEIAGSLDYAPQWPLAAYQTALDPAAQPARIALVAESDDGRIAGFLIASLLPPQAELESIAVSVPFQRMGIARALVSALIQELPRAGAREIILEVRASNAAAQALYRSAGFSEVARRKHYYQHPSEDGVTFLLVLP